MSAEPFDIDVELDERPTEPAPNANTEEVARELEKLALLGFSKTNRPADLLDGWRCGVRDAAEYVRNYGKREDER